MADLIKNATFLFADAQLLHDRSGNYQYTDDFFRGDAREMDPHLRTMSMAQAMSCFPSAEADAPEEACRNAKSLLLEIGFSDIVVNEDYKRHAEKNTLGILAAHKVIEAEGEQVSLVTLGLRGSDYGDEWIDNFLIGERGPAQSFMRDMEKTADFLRDYLDRIRDKRRPRVKYWFPGYSRVAAVVNLLGAKMGRESGAWHTRPEDLYIYTFECPAVAAEDEPQDCPYIHNTFSSHDLVRMLAPQTWGFARYGVDAPLPRIRSNLFRKTIAEVKSRVAALNPDVVYDPETFEPQALIGAKVRTVPAREHADRSRCRFAYLDDYLEQMMEHFSREGLDLSDKRADKKRRGRAADHVTGEELRHVFVRTLQPSIAWTAAFYFGAPPPERVRMRQNIQYILEGLSLFDKLHLYLHLLAGRERDLTAIETKFAEALRVRILNDPASPLDDAGITDLYAHIQPIVRFFMRILSKDARNYRFYYLLTLVHNLHHIVPSHLPEVIFAWLQALDDWY